MIKRPDILGIVALGLLLAYWLIVGADDLINACM